MIKYHKPSVRYFDGPAWSIKITIKTTYTPDHPSRRACSGYLNRKEILGGFGQSSFRVHIIDVQLIERAKLLFISLNTQTNLHLHKRGIRREQISC